MLTSSVEGTVQDVAKRIEATFMAQGEILRKLEAEKLKTSKVEHQLIALRTDLEKQQKELVDLEKEISIVIDPAVQAWKEKTKQLHAQMEALFKKSQSVSEKDFNKEIKEPSAKIQAEMNKEARILEDLCQSVQEKLTQADQKKSDCAHLEKDIEFTQDFKLVKLFLKQMQLIGEITKTFYQHIAEVFSFLAPEQKEQLIQKIKKPQINDTDSRVAEILKKKRGISQEELKELSTYMLGQKIGHVEAVQELSSFVEGARQVEATPIQLSLRKHQTSLSRSVAFASPIRAYNQAGGDFKEPEAPIIESSSANGLVSAQSGIAIQSEVEVRDLQARNLELETQLKSQSEELQLMTQQYEEATKRGEDALAELQSAQASVTNLTKKLEEQTKESDETILKLRTQFEANYNKVKTTYVDLKADYEEMLEEMTQTIEEKESENVQLQEQLALLENMCRESQETRVEVESGFQRLSSSGSAKENETTPLKTAHLKNYLRKIDSNSPARLQAAFDKEGDSPSTPISYRGKTRLPNGFTDNKTGN